MRDLRAAAYIIRQRVSALQAGEDLGLGPDRNGRCLCPFHNDSHPSLQLYDGNRGFYCFSCHAHGDVIDLVRQVHGCGAWDAVRLLNDTYRLGLDLDGSDLRKARQAAEENRRRREQMKRRQEKALEGLWNARDAWMDNEATLRATAPRGPSEGIPDVFADAMIRREQLMEDLYAAEAECWDCGVMRC